MNKDASTIHFLSNQGIEMKTPLKKTYIIYLKYYTCIKQFDEIPLGFTVSAGYDLEKGGFIISHDSFEGIVIGSVLFHEHFELDVPTPIELVMTNSKALKYEINRLKNKKYF